MAPTLRRIRLVRRRIGTGRPEAVVSTLTGAFFEQFRQPPADERTAADRTGEQIVIVGLVDAVFVEILELIGPPAILLLARRVPPHGLLACLGYCVTRCRQHLLRADRAEKLTAHRRGRPWSKRVLTTPSPSHFALRFQRFPGRALRREATQH